MKKHQQQQDKCKNESGVTLKCSEAKKKRSEKERKSSFVQQEHKDDVFGFWPLLGRPKKKGKRKKK